MDALGSSLWGRQQREVIVIGLDAAGKTTTLQSMKSRQGGQIQTHIPTVGFLLETLEFEGSAKFMTLKAWDVGGRTFIRPLLRHWFATTDGIVFVVDSCDRERLQDARHELDRVLAEEELHGKPLLVLANKQDLPFAANTTELVEKLGLHSLRHRMWFIQEWIKVVLFVAWDLGHFKCWKNVKGTSMKLSHWCLSLQESVATTGSGLWEGLDWLASAMKSQSKPQPPARPTVGLKMPKSMEKDLADDVSTADTEDVSTRAELTQS